MPGEMLAECLEHFAPHAGSGPAQQPDYLQCDGLEPHECDPEWDEHVAKGWFHFWTCIFWFWAFSSSHVKD